MQQLFLRSLAVVPEVPWTPSPYRLRRLTGPRIWYSARRPGRTLPSTAEDTSQQPRVRRNEAGVLETDWFFGVVVSVVVLVLSGGDLLQSLERKAYDFGIGARLRARPVRPDRRHRHRRAEHRQHRPLAVVARGACADMIDKLAAAKAKVIAPPSLFSEPQTRSGSGLHQQADRALTPRPADCRDGHAGGTRRPEPAAARQPGRTAAEAEQKLNTDRRLAASLAQAGNVVLPMLFRPR